MLDVKISIPKIIFNYIYDFFTYKKVFNLRVFFEEMESEKDGFNYFYIRCVNKTTYNIQITKIYINNPDNCELEFAHYFYQNFDRQIEYKNIGKSIFSDREDLNLNSDLNLTPCDSQERRFFVNGGSESKNEMRVLVRVKVIKGATIVIEYKVKDIKKSFFSNNTRSFKTRIPL